MNENSYLIPSEICDYIDEIKKDTTSGATKLTKQGIQTVLQLLEKTTTTSVNQFINQLVTTLRYLVSAQPLMASLFTFANTTLLNLQHQSATNIPLLKTLIRSHSQKFLHDFTKSNEIISIYTEKLIGKKKIIFTFSSSSTVYEALLYAHKKGRRFIVHCSESRPTNEGIQLANNLAEGNIQTVLSTDVALFNKIEQADIVLIGADSITFEGIYHKMGTQTLARQANSLRIPIYSLSAREKIVPKDYVIPEEPQRNPYDLTNNQMKSMHIENHYFDITPLEMFSGIITQQGLNNHGQLKKLIKGLKLHKEFIS